ncbi:transposase, partial [Pseudomonadota bacterium]
HTSIRERLQPEFNLPQAIDDQTNCGDLLNFTSSLKPLLPFENRLTNKLQNGILFSFEEYLALVDWTGRIIRNDKRGHIDNALPPILNRLQISPEQWHINTTQFEAIHPRRFNRLTPQLDTG